MLIVCLFTFVCQREIIEVFPAWMKTLLQGLSEILLSDIFIFYMMIIFFELNRFVPINSDTGFFLRLKDGWNKNYVCLF